MAKSKNQTVIDLKSLSQQQTAWLLGRSPKWLRDNAQLFRRDAKGCYDAAQAVQALLQYEQARRPPAYVF